MDSQEIVIEEVGVVEVVTEVVIVVDMEVIVVTEGKTVAEEEAEEGKSTSFCYNYDICLVNNYFII